MQNLAGHVLGQKVKIQPLISACQKSSNLFTLLAAKICVIFQLVNFFFHVLQLLISKGQFLISLLQSDLLHSIKRRRRQISLWLRLRASHMLKCDLQRFALKPNHSQGAVIAVFDCADFTCGLGFAWACLAWRDFSCSPPVKS